MIEIAIDPGTRTGIAVKRDGEFIEIVTSNIIAAMEICLSYKVDNPIIYVEDARKRKWFGNSGRERLQGAGSIKRDSAIWNEFLIHHGFEYKLLSPQQKGAKMDPKLFARVTGWKKRTSEHSRDAASLII